MSRGKISPPTVIRTPRSSIRWTLELLLDLTFQRVALRYKETFLGFGWILLQPVALTVIFTYIRRVATISSGNIPYPLFAAVGLVGWSFTALAITQSLPSFVANAPMLKRVALPKAVFPVSAVLSTVADLLVMLTLGLYWPFAAVAITRLRVQAVTVKTRMNPEALVAMVRSAEGEAAGDMAGDFFGLDIGL